MLAIIPARGGSKGLPHKNILPLCGRPMVAYAIDAALHAAEIDRVIVSTEDEDVARVARESGAEVPFMRPATLATDEVPSGEACLHVIDRLPELEGSARQAFALVQATCPLVRADDIDAAVTAFEQRKANAVVTLRSVEHPIENVYTLAENGNGRILNVLRNRYGVEPLVGRRQELGRRYRISGAVVVVRVDRMRDDVNYYFRDPDVCGVVVADERGVDVDSLLDFRFAELLLQDQARRADRTSES